MISHEIKTAMTGLMIEIRDVEVKRDVLHELNHFFKNKSGLNEINELNKEIVELTRQFNELMDIVVDSVDAISDSFSIDLLKEIEMSIFNIDVPFLTLV